MTIGRETVRRMRPSEDDVVASDRPLSGIAIVLVHLSLLRPIEEVSPINMIKIAIWCLICGG